MTLELSVFQVTCEAALNDRLQFLGMTTSDREIEAVKPSFVAGLLSNGKRDLSIALRVGHLFLWIYADGCEMRRGEHSTSYEREDFSSSPELQRAFVGAVIAALNDS